MLSLREAKATKQSHQKQNVIPFSVRLPHRDKFSRPVGTGMTGYNVLNPKCLKSKIKDEIYLFGSGLFGLGFIFLSLE